MLDVIFPVTRNNIGPACASLDALFSNTDVVTRIIAIFDGGKRVEYQAVENVLRESEKEWVAMHTIQPQYFNKCIVAALAEKVIHDRVATLMPGVILKDKFWFLKMCAPFGKDHHAAMSIAGAVDTPSTTLPPHRVSKNVDYSFGGLAMLKDWTKRKVKELSLPESGLDVITSLTKFFRDAGHNVWRVPSVNYQLIDRKEHALS